MRKEKSEGIIYLSFAIQLVADSATSCINPNKMYMEENNMKCKIIAVCNKKGGVGKTTSTVNIGARLANLGKKVLLIDLDSQGSLTASLGKEPEKIEINISTLLETYMSKADNRDELIEQATFDIKKNLWLIAANDSLSGTKEKMIIKTSREFYLSKVIKEILEIYTFDYILIDCSPSIDTLTINAFTAAHSVIIPMTPAYLEYQGFRSFYNNILEVKEEINPNLSVEGILLTKYQGNLSLAKGIKSTLEKIEQEYGLNLFNTRISQCVKAAEAPLAGQDIFDYAPKSKTALEYIQLVDELLSN